MREAYLATAAALVRRELTSRDVSPRVRLARAFSPRDYAAVFADPDQWPLSQRPLATSRTILTMVEGLPPGR